MSDIGFIVIRDIGILDHLFAIHAFAIALIGTVALFSSLACFLQGSKDLALTRTPDQPVSLA